ncbi:MAG: ribonuclease HI [bacterium]
MKEVKLYTDGACQGNPGPGGYGIILIYNNHRKEFSGGFRNTTNNRMELIAIINGLEQLKEKCKVTIFTDSQYVVNSINKGWARKWQKNNWYRNKEEKAANTDLWQKLLNLCDNHQVAFIWIKGHNNHPENEYCDQLAVAAAKKPNLPLDEGYLLTV